MCVPGNIVSPEFRRRVFEEAGIVERISIIQRGADAWRGINVARHCSEGCFTDDEAESLVELALLVLPMLPVNRQRQVQAHPLSVAQLESRFESRFEILTPRERQVCARAAAGMSVAATADDLGIAPSSVLTYRQRAYQRLESGQSRRTAHADNALDTPRCCSGAMHPSIRCLDKKSQ